MKMTYEAKGMFRGHHPFIAQPLTLKTAIKTGEIIGVAANGDYGKYDESTYTQVYAIATQDVELTSGTAVSEALLTAYLVKDFVKFTSTEAAKILKETQELRKIGIFIG